MFKSLVLKQSPEPLGSFSDSKFGAKEVRMSKGRSQVLGHLREVPRALPQLHKTWSGSPLGQSLAKFHALGHWPSVQMPDAGKQMQRQPVRPFEPSQGVSNEGFCFVVNSDVCMF